MKTSITRKKRMVEVLYVFKDRKLVQVWRVYENGKLVKEI